MTKDESAVKAADEIRKEQGREPSDEDILLPEPASPEEDLARDIELSREPREFMPRRKGCGDRR